MRNPLLFISLFVAALVFGHAPEWALETPVANASLAILPDSLVKKVDALFAQFDLASSPGCALAILKDGKTIYQQGYGMASLEYGIGITPASVFNGASLSKQFTAAAIVTLALEGKLSLKDDIRKYLPQVPDFDHGITLTHLLHHTSGVRDQWDLQKLAGWRGGDVITEGDVLEMVQRQKGLNFVPGAEFSYSNTGYTLLGLVVKKVTGMTLQEYADSVFFQPLRMHQTHFQDDHTEVVPNATSAYQKDPKGHWKIALPANDTYGATGLMTTVEDLAKWDAHFYAKLAEQKAFVEAMQRVGSLNDKTLLLYASGLALQTYKGQQAFWHPGSESGYRAVYLRFPGHHFSIILLGNAAGMNAESLAKKVADLFLPDHTDRKQPLAQKIDTAALGIWAGTYWDSTSNSRVVLTYQAGSLLKGNDLLVALSEKTFLDPKAEAAYAFQSNPTGASLEVSVKGNKKTTYQKVNTITLLPHQLQEYTGQFYSPELEVWYTFSLQKQGLLAQVPRNVPFPLNPFTKDVFTSPVNIQFTRNANNEISGFFLTLGKTRNLRFQKASKPGIF